MAKSAATTVADYLAELPPDRRKIVKTVRTAMKKRMPKGFAEGMDWGVICYYVPPSVLPETYNGRPLMYAGLSAQKNYSVVYLMSANEKTPVGKRMAAEFAAAGKKLKMGGSCIRFNTLDDISLDAIGNAVAALSIEQWIDIHKQSRAGTKTGARKIASAKKKPASQR